MRPIELAQMIVMKIPKNLVTRCDLSVQWALLNGSRGFCRDKQRAATDPKVQFEVAGYDEKGVHLRFKLPYRDYDRDRCLLPYSKHLEMLGLTPEDKWLIIGARNLGNNLRIVAWGVQTGLLELEGENATTSDREYTCLCRTVDDKLIIDRIRFRGGRPSRDDLEWAMSGQELVWDGAEGPLDRIIPFTYDLRHVWQIPGLHLVGAGGNSQVGSLIEEMIDRFMELKDGPDDDLTAKLQQLADERGYTRQRNYLHSAIGVSEDGESLVIVQRHGAFEDVAQTLINAGAFRGIELDQGGSVSAILGDRNSKDFPSGRTLMSSHYFRPYALGLLVFHLAEADEGTFSENSAMLA